MSLTCITEKIFKLHNAPIFQTSFIQKLYFTLCKTSGRLNQIANKQEKVLIAASALLATTVQHAKKNDEQDPIYRDELENKREEDRWNQ